MSNEEDLYVQMSNIPVVEIVQELQGASAVYYDILTILLPQELWLLLHILVTYSPMS